MYAGYVGMLPPGELRWVCWQYVQMDASPFHYIFRHWHIQCDNLIWCAVGCSIDITWVTLPCIVCIDGETLDIWHDLTNNYFWQVVFVFVKNEWRNTGNWPVKFQNANKF